jgi:thioredoxin 1
MQHLDEKTVAGVLANATLPVVLDFWGPSCAPCIILNKYLEELAPEFSGKLLFYKLNADDAPDTAADYGVRGLPTIALIKKGQAVATQVGTLSLAKLKALLTDWANP